MAGVGVTQLREFDPASAELYAAVSSDSRLRLWNTASGEARQTYVEPQNLAKRYTCMAWHRPSAKSKRSRSGTTKPSALGMIALGTDKGTITVWDLKRGAVAHNLGEGTGLPAVTSVVFSTDGGSIFSSSSAKDVIEWNLETGAVARKLKGFKHGSTQMCLHPAGRVLAVASSSIRLVDVATGKTARKLSAGHAGAVRLLFFSADGRYLASSASSSRFVTVFDVAGDEPSSDPVATLGFAATPSFLALHASVGGDKGDQLTVIAGFDTGGVSLLRTRRRADGKDGAVRKLDIGGAGGASSPSALHVRLSSERPSSGILIAFGNPTSPDFAEAVFEDASGALLRSSVVGGEVAAEEDRPEDVGAKDTPAHVVGPGELGIKGVEKDNLPESVSPGDEITRASKLLKTGGKKADEVAAMTIAERLEALSEAVDHEAARHRSDRREGRGRDGGVLALASGAGAGRDGAIQPRVESLSTVLTQALQSGDENLLEQCLAVGDLGVIEATVERLPSSKVLLFLLRVVAKLEKRPNRAGALGRWIRSLLSCHLGYLVSVNGLPDKLALLHQLIDRRVASFPKLLQLHGRLDLLLARVKVDGSRCSGQGQQGRDPPEAVYREEDDEARQGDDDGQESSEREAEGEEDSDDDGQGSFDGSEDIDSEEDGGDDSETE